jgi:hypothetical protein
LADFFTDLLFKASGKGLFMKMDQLCSPFLGDYLKTYLGAWSLSETKATCHDCLCSKPQRGALPYYRPDLKCCTFHPFLPNYEVGAILSSSEVSNSVKDLLRKKIAQRQYALPMGIFAPVSYQVRFNNRAPEDFGNRSEFLCPYFDSQKMNCGIWRHRGSVCSSYFCVSDRGSAGLEFWQQLGDFLHVCEMVLAQDSLVSMGMPAEGIDAQLEYVNCETGTSEELSSASMSEALFRSFWTEWDGSIEEFYLSCNRYVNGLGVSGLRELLYEETQAQEESLRQFYQENFIPNP